MHRCAEVSAVVSVASIYCMLSSHFRHFLILIATARAHRQAAQRQPELINLLGLQELFPDLQVSGGHRRDGTDCLADDLVLATSILLRKYTPHTYKPSMHTALH